MKKPILIMSITFILLCNVAFGVSQGWVAIFGDTGTDYTEDITVDGAGNVYVTGWTNPGSDCNTVKYDSAGNELWSANYDSGGGDGSNAVAVDSAGNVYITGYAWGGITKGDILTVKYNSAGVQQWASTYDESGEYDETWDIVVDSSGNSYVTGGVRVADGSWDCITIKYDSAGNQKWAMKYDTNGYAGVALKLDSAENNVYVGSASTGVDLDYLVIKYRTSDGLQQWAKTYDGGGIDHVEDLDVDSSDNVYVTGEATALGNPDCITVKYDSAGNEKWAKTYDSGASDKGNAIVVDSSGNAYVTGMTGGGGTVDYLTIMYDSTGAQQWVSLYDGPVNGDDGAVDIDLDELGNVYVTGESDAAAGQTDYATVMYDSAGNQQWVARYDQTGLCDSGVGIAVYDSNNIYVTGDSDGFPPTYQDYATVKYIQAGGPGPIVKWEQKPDKSIYGIDIRCDRSDGIPRLLADDFECTTTGLITDVHIWGSWEYDEKGEIIKIHLSIHEDIPASESSTGYSMPGEELWAKDFYPGDFNESQIPLMDHEYWWDPYTGVLDMHGDFNIWKYDIYIDPAEAFTQQGSPDAPKVYWLDLYVEVDPYSPGEFGWKTREWPEHYNDDAVFDQDGWRELRYPLEHPYYYEDQNSIDMAFAITTQEEPNQPTAKWVQEPDLSETGIDVNATAPYILADDFECTVEGPITEIAIWGSWLDDRYPWWEVPDAVTFTLSIHDDIPADPCDPDSYSMPGELLWIRTFEPGQFTAEVYARDIYEGWLDPPAGYIFPADWTCWKYTFQLDPRDTFVQQGDPCNPVIYWLDVQAISEDMEASFGWKTSLDHWNDDAVWAVGVEGDHSPWQELLYPDRHPYYPNSIDLAFKITTQELPEPKPPVPHLKWSQPPIEIDPNSDVPTYCGWDEPSHLIEPGFWKVVADDFRCLGTMPVTSIHWWGSYYYWEGNEPPLPEPVAWKIGFWSNVPDPDPCDPLTFSYPKELLWQIEVPADRVDVNNVGQDYFPDRPSDTCFQYYVDLDEEEYFWQNDFIDITQDNIFWLSIVAVYGEPYDYEWGWKTRPWHWMDDAVSFWLEGPFEPPVIVDPLSSEMMPIKGYIGEVSESYDVAFELDTDPNYIKWEQPFTGLRHWPHYEDEQSTGFVERWTESETKWLQTPDLSPNGIDVDATMELAEPIWPPQILADDFNCTESEPITDISIWGSWFNDEMPYGDPIAVEFTLCIYSDDPCGPSGWSEPNELLWRMDFPAGAFTVEYAWEGPEGYFNPCMPEYYLENHWNAWKYNFHIDPCEAFIQQGDPCEPTVYWLAVQARPIPMEEPPPWPIRFGWKTSIERWNDDAVWTIGEEGLPYEPWVELRHPETGESLDLAFEITTEKEYQELYIDFAVADDWHCQRRTPVTAVVWWGSYMGYQYLACQEEPMIRPVKPDYFLLNIWTDVPAANDIGDSNNCCYSHPWPGCDDPCCEASVCSYDPYCCDIEWDGICADEASTDPNCDCTGELPYSHPARKVWEYKAYNYDEVLVGYDKYPEDEPPIQTEPVFRYSVRLPEEDWFCQPDVNSIYWLSIVAVWDENEPYPDYPWGWTNHEHVFNDDAVEGWPGSMEFSGYDEWYWEELYDQTGMSEDMSFVLFTDPNICCECADYNLDIIVNFKDYADFADDWLWTGTPGGYNNSDLDCDGDADYYDLKIFADQWLQSCP